ncbi:MAG TPA: IS110 family transposase [Chloroflexota bacterium]|nr:IS110 family transposase [Chloroflexota bacterium]
MTSRVTVAVDLAKTVFQVVVADERGKITERRRLTRPQFERFWENRAACRVLMEACGSAHHWGRWLLARGFDVVLLPAHSVTPYVQRNKTDERDAEGLLEAVRSPRVHAVAVKSRDQQQIQALHRVREQWKRTRTQRINGMRGLLREFGLICSVGAEKLMKALPVLLQEHSAEVPPRVRTVLWQMHQEVRELEVRIEGIEQELEAIARENEIIGALREIPGVGLLTATALYAAVGDIQSFQSARHLASWLGLTPRERSSGTRRRLGRISKQGDVYLRMLLIHGARSALLVAQQRQRAEQPVSHLQRWALKRAEATHVNKAAVALANKLARVVWAVWRRQTRFDGNYVPMAA